MTEKTLTTENIKPALDALRGELAPWPVVAKKQDRLNTAQLNAANSGITSSLVAQIIANTAAIRALESAITGTGLRALVVSSLPAVGTLGILYIVPVTTYDPATDADVVNYSNEYIWIVAPDAPVTEGYYEQVGQTGIVINNGQLTITVNGTSVGTFTANQSGDTTAAITVPTNADYVDKTTDQSIAGVKTFSSTINGTASKAIADEDGTSIKTGYVNVAGNQTVSGQKTWSGNNTWGTNLLTVKDSAFTKGTSVTDRKQNLWKFTDSNDSVFGIWEAIQYTSGIQGIRLNVTNKYKNGALDPTGDDVPVYFEFLQKETDGQTILKWGSGLVANGIYPLAPYGLGNAAYQWSSVYAQTYYYNGTAWGLDKANVWTQSQTISINLPALTLQDIYGERDKTPGNTRQLGIYFCDKNGATYSFINRQHRATTGTHLLQANIENGTYDYRLQFYLYTDGSSDFVPSNNGIINLGTSTNKWKTLNGVNPGALSLPTSSYVEIDTTNWDLTGATSQSYTPTVHGWLYISIQNIAGNYLSMSGGRGAVSMDGTGAQAGLRAMLPVIANESVAITVKTGSIFAARFYPMLGNV